MMTIDTAPVLEQPCVTAGSGDPEPLRRQEWYGIEEAAEALHRSRRSLYRELNTSSLTGSAVRTDPAYSGRGRPPVQLHYTALPGLMAHYRVETRQQMADAAAGVIVEEERRKISADDMAIAKFRALAVEEYIKLRMMFSGQEELAARTVCEDWQHSPR